MDRITFCWLCTRYLGTSMLLSTTGAGFCLVDFPFSVAISGPKIFSARSISLVVTGLSPIEFVLMIVLKSLIDGVPIA